MDDRKNGIRAMLLVAFSVLAAGMVPVFPAQAQHACPSGPGQGEVQVGESNGEPFCDWTRQSQAPQRLPERWQDHWGAIATDEPRGALGTVVNKTSQDEAEQAALAGCRERGGASCKVQLSYRNQCAAMVVGGKIFNVNSGATIEEATQKGMRMCSTAASDCHVYYSACSLPIRLQ